MLKKNLLIVVLLFAMGVSMNPRLALTDGTTTIDLLGCIGGYDVDNWFQQIPQFKGGGVLQNSSLATGQRLIDSRFDSITDEFPLVMRGADNDGFATVQQSLVRLLEKAADYWRTDWYNSPVWLERRAPCETETSYALVNFGSLAELANQMTEDFAADSAQGGLTLRINHGIWQSHEPFDSECVELSAEQDYFLPAAQVTITATPLAATDFFSAIPEFSAFTTGVGIGRAGLATAIPTDLVYESGVRFQNVNVPQGSTIIEAYITFTAGPLSGGTTCNLIIGQEKTGNAAAFSTWGDWQSRFFYPEPMASQLWFNVPHWVGAGTYTTQNLNEMVQYIVDLPTWAAGNAMAMWFLDADSDSNAYRDYVAAIGGAAEPILTIVYSGTDTSMGRDETCEKEVYITNHSKIANITHYYTRTNANAWSLNLQTGAPAHNLLTPAVIVNGDSAIFGIETDLAESGPFTSAVFDVNAQAVYGGDATCTWQYWNGGWQTLPVTDNTGGGFGSIQPFENADVNSAHWKAPSDWVIGNLNTIFGGGAPNINGYWVRILCNVPAAPADSISTPTQQNRLVYTISWPRVDIAADQVPGDIEALARHLIYNESDKYKFLSNPLLSWGRTAVGLRSIDRGADFNAYINFSDEQNTPGITVATIGATPVFATDVQAPTGRIISSTNSGQILSISFTPDLARQYSGRYTAFMRVQSIAATSLFRLSIRPTDSTSISKYLPWSLVSSAAQFQTVFLGSFDFPGTSASPDEQVLMPQIVVDAQHFAAGTTKYYDLIMIPTDEWFGDFQTVPNGYSYTVHSGRYLDVDSIDNPKYHVRSVVKDTASDMLVADFIPVTNGQVQLRQNAQQRLWFYSMEKTFLNAPVAFGNPEISARVQSFRVSRYLGMRGNR